LISFVSFLHQGRKEKMMKKSRYEMCGYTVALQEERGDRELYKRAIAKSGMIEAPDEYAER
jgi:hypothetical protein